MDFLVHWGTGQERSKTTISKFILKCKGLCLTKIRFYKLEQQCSVWSNTTLLFWDRASCSFSGVLHTLGHTAVYITKLYTSARCVGVFTPSDCGSTLEDCVRCCRRLDCLGDRIPRPNSSRQTGTSARHPPDTPEDLHYHPKNKQTMIVLYYTEHIKKHECG